MTIIEALTEIQSRNKAYADVGMEQGYFSNTIKAIRWGSAKQKTVDKFMSKFGYIKNPDNWEKHPILPK